MALERELKYSSPEGQVPALADISAALAELGAEATDLGAATHVDVYYDDDAATVQRAGLALRVRSSDAGRVAALKSRGSVMHGVHERDEVEVALPAGTGPVMREWPAEFHAHLQVASLATLTPRMIITTERHRFAVLEGGVPLAELAFDEVTCRPAAEVALQYSIDEVLFHEVELEALTSGGRPPVPAQRLEAYGAQLQELLPLYPSGITKLERATTLLAAFAE